MDAEAQAAGTVESRAEAAHDDAALIRLWKDAIELQRKTEERWRKQAEAAIDRYRDEQDRKTARFNILFANIQTTLPALYNSTPIPDVRRRFGDPDAAGKVAAQMLERVLSYTLDAYDFDSAVRSAVFDAELAGRGVVRVRYEPTFGEDGETLADEAVTCELVNWRDFIRGPGRDWREVPWVVFVHRLTRDELAAQFGDIGSTMELDFVQSGAEGRKTGDKRDVPDVFKRGTVYEVWDKQAREVLFIAETVNDQFLRREPDPLRLRDFFPTARPLYGVFDSSSLVPVCPYDMYRDQAVELDRVTARITALVRVLRFRGFRAAELPDWSKFADADDGDLLPVQDWQQFTATAGNGFDKAVWFMPIEMLVATIRELVAHREQIKQVIYEITGLSDILRGATEASETATAQQIKTQWGSLRLQDRQKEVQRFARDIVRLKAELIAERFQPQTLSMVTGIDLPDAATKAMMVEAQQMPPDQPTWEDVLGVLRSDAMRSYRIDIETDSTIQADVVRAQQNAAGFVQGFAGFVEAVGPAVQAGMMPVDVASDLLTAFARHYKLGRQAEDALERLGQVAQQMAAQPQQDPMAQEAARMEADATLKREEIASRERTEAAKQAGETERHRMSIEAEAARAQAERDASGATAALEQVQQFAAALQAIAGQISQVTAAVQALAADAAAPRQIVRGPDGRAAGVQVGNRVRRLVRDANGTAVGLQ